MKKLLLLTFFVCLILNQTVLSQEYSPLQNLLRYDAASVVISDDGCSGTLICPRTVLTAAHCQTTGNRVIIILSNGNRVTGKVIAHKEQKRDGVDAAIIRLDSKVEGIDPVSFASDYPPDGTEVIVYGRALSSGNSKITKFRSTVDLRGDGSWLDLVGGTAAIGGESGGGVFYDGKCIGVVSRSNSNWKGKIEYGTWTGVSVTDKTYDLVSKYPCSDKDCLT